MKQKIKLGIGVLGMIMGLMILLGVLPGMSKTALADDGYPLWVGGTHVTPENATSPDHPTWKYDVASNTLTLTNYTYSGDGYKGYGESYGIWYDGTGDLEIVLKGDSSITLNDNEDSGVVGIYFDKDNEKLIISGDGSLSIKCGRALGGGTYGIRCGSLTVKGATIHILATWGQLGSFGIDSMRDVDINGGNIFAVAGENYLSYGINANREINIRVDKNAALFVEGHTSALNPYIKVSNSVAGTGWKSLDGQAIEIEASNSPRSLDPDPNNPYKRVVFPRHATIINPPTAISGLKYTGSLQQLINPGKAVGGTVKYAIKTTPSTPGENEYTYDNDNLPKATDIGTYYIYYMVKGDDYHLDSEGTNYIEAKIGEVPGIKFDTDNMTLTEGETKKITPTVIPQGAKVTWTSADKNTATVDENGNVTGISEGTTIITGTIKVDEKEYKAECEVKVTKLPNITLDTTEMSLMVDEVRPVKATTVPGDATVAWTSADKSIATVDDKGNVTGVSEGTTTITGTITVDQKEYSAKCEVKVTATPGITFDTKEMSLKVGEEKTIAATTVPKDAKVAWISDDYDIAKVDENGKVTGVSEGTTTITGIIIVDDKPYSAVCKVTVTKGEPVIPSIKFDVTDLSLKVGDERTIEATTVPKDSKVTWTTDKESVAKVDDTGKVTAVSEGTTVITGTITAGEQELSEKCTVTVSKDTPQPEDISITLSLSETTITQGMERALKATTKPDGKAVTWSSSDSNIASVDGNGIVKGIKPGTAIITATITVDGKEYSATCKVTVVPVGFIPKGSSNEGHVHKFIWDTVEATEDADGELRYQCEICGMIKERVPLTAYNVFNKNTTEKIRKASKDATVKIETRKWISFHKMVMEALSERPDVTLEITFLDGEYKGNRCTVTIPKGIDDMSLVDKNGFTGFLYLGGKFGMKTNPN